MVREAYSPIGRNAIQAELATDLVKRSGSRDRGSDCFHVENVPRKRCLVDRGKSEKKGDTTGGMFTLPADRRGLSLRRGNLALAIAS